MMSCQCSKEFASARLPSPRSNSKLGLVRTRRSSNKMVQCCSTDWTEADLLSLLDYGKTTTAGAPLLLRIFQKLTTGPTQFNVPVRHFKEVVEHFGVKHQYVRTSFTCAMYGADRKSEKEVKHVRWSRQAGADCHL